MEGDMRCRQQHFRVRGTKPQIAVQSATQRRRDTIAFESPTSHLASSPSASSPGVGRVGIREEPVLRVYHGLLRTRGRHTLQAVAVLVVGVVGRGRAIGGHVREAPRVVVGVAVERRRAAHGLALRRDATQGIARVLLGETLVPFTLAVYAAGSPNSSYANPSVTAPICVSLNSPFCGSLSRVRSPAPVSTPSSS